MFGLIPGNKGGITSYNRTWSFQWLIGPAVLFPRQTVLMNSSAPAFGKRAGVLFFNSKL